MERAASQPVPLEVANDACFEPFLLLRSLLRWLPQSRDPARHRAAIFFIRIAKLAAERGFFVEDHKEIGRYKEECRIFQEYHRSKQYYLAKKHSEYTHVHRVANVPVQGSSDQKFSWRDGRRSSQSANRELPCAAEIDRRSQENDESAEPRQRTVSRSRKAAQNPARNQNEDRSRHENRKQDRLQDWAENTRPIQVRKLKSKEPSARQPAQPYCKIKDDGRELKTQLPSLPEWIPAVEISETFHPPSVRANPSGWRCANIHMEETRRHQPWQ
jgi:hypothetical protein